MQLAQLGILSSVASRGIAIAGIDVIKSIRVPLGTTFGSINFSDYGLTTVKAIRIDGAMVDVPIVWTISSYNSGVAATYTVYGNLVPPSGTSNSLGITPQISVEVVNLETEYQTLLNRGTTLGYTLPSPISQGNENRLMIYLKTISASLVVFQNYMTDGDSDFATLNWITPAANQATKVSSPTFTSKVGFTFNGTSSYLNSSFNGATQGGSIFTQNNAGFGAYVYTGGTGGYIVGQVATGARNSLTASGYTRVLDINDNTVQSLTDYWGPGLYHAYRTGSTQVNLAKNGCTVATAVTGTSVARPSNNMYIGARNNAGTADSFDTSTVSMFWAGAALDSSIDAFYTNWFTFLDSQRPTVTHTTPADVGTVLNDSFARSALGVNYTVAGTWTPNGSLLPISGGSNTFTLRCKFAYGNSCQNSITSSTFTLTAAPSGTTYGLGVGYSDFSSPDQERSIVVKLDLTNTANQGKLFIYTYDGTSGVSVGSASAALSVSNGDSFTLVVTKQIVSGNMKYVAVATRLADSSTCTSEYSAFTGDSSSEPSLWNFGGAINITNLTYQVLENKDENICTIGDSLTYGAFAATVPQGYAYNINSSYNVSGGPGDYTATVVKKMRSLVDLNAKYYLVMIGGNDVSGGISSGVYQNNHKQFIRSLRNQGFKVIILNVAPRNDGNMTTINSFFSSQYTDLLIIDTYTPLVGTGTDLNAAYNFGDNVHWNTAGHTLEAGVVAAALPVLY